MQLFSSPFTSWAAVNLRTWINRRREWIILSVRSLTVFGENIVVTVLAKLVWLFFQKCTCPFFFLRALQLTCVRLWQILVKIMFQSLLGSLLNHLCLIHYVHENVLVKHLSLICITSILTTIYPLKILLNLWRILL